MPTHRLVERHPLTAYRIGDPKGTYPIFSAEGSRRNAARWHKRGQRMIYSSEHYSTAMLEKLVHYSGKLPPNQHFIEITIPVGVSYEEVSTHTIPGWYKRNMRNARTFGAKWYDEARSAILIVPSVVARMENNILINSEHSDFAMITYGREVPVPWDARLFTASTP